MKTNKKAGFTLIELMVVMAIIGVLAVTIVPQLTGAQSRARDAGRISSIKQMTAVLETYNSDEGTYPLATDNVVNADDSGGTHCLSGTGGTVNSDLAALLKGGKAPLDPQKKNFSGNCLKPGVIGYSALTKNGIGQGGYILITNVEAFKKANLDFNLSGRELNQNGDTTYAIVQAWAWGKLAQETNNAKDSVYAEIN